MIDPTVLLSAYASGYFPMGDSASGEIGWYSPDPRAVIPLDTFRIPRSLRQACRKELFEIRIDTAFGEVIRSCAAREETWITPPIIDSYTELFRLGYAHSVETWKGGSLAGGLYGVALGGAFFGESMFSRERDASKIALVALVERMNRNGFALLDTQFVTPHLARFGTVEIPRRAYLGRLRRAVRLDCSFLD
ncbi:MAG TPA: leucyl/phenylalanyl-tRNA--protein transferase [Bacteroidota bacterium]|nr:leucyl/phenylalanyl-tRNA--protein transferase [Bacteroidota bacterium]